MCVIKNKKKNHGSSVSYEWTRRLSADCVHNLNPLWAGWDGCLSVCSVFIHLFFLLLLLTNCGWEYTNSASVNDCFRDFSAQCDLYDGDECTKDGGEGTTVFFFFLVAHRLLLILWGCHHYNSAPVHTLLHMCEWCTTPSFAPQRMLMSFQKYYIRIFL